MEERLVKLRAVMKEKNVHAWIIPSADPHNSEYVAPHFAARAWFSGFTGSAGTLVLTLTQAALWTDSRYALQAAAELAGSQITLFVEGQPDVPDMAAWLSQNLQPSQTVSFDGRCIHLNSFSDLEKKLSFKDIRLVPGADLPGSVWEKRPALPKEAIIAWDGPDWQGGRKARLDRILRHLSRTNRDWIVISALDQIAWILGLRGNDIPFNPLFLSYLLVGPRGSVLFIDRERLEQSAAEALLEDGIIFSPYDSVGAYLQTLASEDRIQLPPESTSLYVFQNASHMRISQEESPVDSWKAVLEAAQIAALRETCIKDGTALVRSLEGVDRKAQEAGLDEHALGLLIAAERAKDAAYRGESFDPIVGFGPHGAVVHYRAPETGSSAIQGQGLLLVDCGGHYQGGTTDITRVFALGGEPGIEEKNVYTLVLKGHIRLATVSFPAGTRGQQLDILARQYLWDKGYNYGHGTGHGIGFGLCVHEGPQRIAPLASRQVLVPGMVLSNEPGCYLENRFGVRIENMVLVANDPHRPGFLCFETLSLFPLEPELLNQALLDAEEKKWINQYHEKVWNSLGKHLDREPKAWLKEKTRPL